MSQEQRPNKEKGNAFPPRKEYPSSQSDYYKSGEQSVEHPMARIDFCPEFLENRCHKGASCRQRHVLYKDLRRELKLIHAPYKKHLCKQFEMGQKCQKPKFTCLFAHGEGDIWNSRFVEKAADEINSRKVDERFTSAKSTEKRQDNSKQDLGKKGKDEYHKVSKSLNDKRDQHKGGLFHVKDEGNQKQPQEKRHMQKKQQEPIPTQCERGNKRSKANINNPEFTKIDAENRNSKRTNGGCPQQPRHASDAMTNEEFEEYLKTLNQEKDEDVWVDEEDDDQSGSDDSDEIDRKQSKSKEDDDEEEEEKEQKRQPVSKEQKKQYDNLNSQNKQEKISQQNEKEKKTSNPEQVKTELAQQKKQKNNQKIVQAEEEVKTNEKDIIFKNKGKSAEFDKGLKDVKSLDWNKINPDEMSIEELMKLNSACLQQLPSSNEDYEDNDDDDEDDEDNYGSDEEVLTKKQTQKILKREDKKDKNQQKQQQQQQPQKNKKDQRSNNNNNNYNKKLSQHTNEVFAMNDQAVEGIDEMEIYAFCYFENAVKLVDWQAQVLQTFQELNIPKNMLLVTEESKCNGQFGMLLKLRSMKIVCLQLLRVNLYKNQHLKILFKLLPNPDSQIVFSKLITPVKKINDYAFQASDGQQCIVYNSRIEKSESENLEFKNYDFRNINENTRKLEEVITGMLNREEFEDESFYQKEKLSGKILLGVKDSTRQFVGSFTTNNHHESFFTFLAKRLRDCHPSISTNQYSREEYRLVIAGEEDNQYYPLLDMKIFALNVNKPAQKTIYQTSSGLYFQKIEEGNWPMSACLLYEKRQKGYISEEKFKFALKQLDRRYFYVMAKMANQNAILDQDQEMYASQFL